MKKLLLGLLSLVTILLLVSGCGKLTADDIVGEYTIDNMAPNKHIYILKEKETMLQNEPVIQMLYVIQRHNDELDKDYFQKMTFYFNEKTGKPEKMPGSLNLITVNSDKEFILNNVKHDKISDTTIAQSDITDVNPKDIYIELDKMPKYQKLYEEYKKDLKNLIEGKPDPIEKIIYY